MKIKALVLLAVLPLALTGCASVSTDDASQQNAAGASSSAGTVTAKKSVDWYAKNYPTFTTKKFHGSSDDIISLPKGAKAGVLIGKYTGDSNFIVEPLDSSNEPTGDFGFNEIGDFKGTTAYGLQALGGKAVRLKVQAQGKWSLTVEEIDKVKTLPKSGKGDGVFKYNGTSKTVRLTHDGKANFLVTEYGDAPISNLQVNEIGPYSGKSLVDAGPAVVTVTADGKWTIT